MIREEIIKLGMAVWKRKLPFLSAASRQRLAPMEQNFVKTVQNRAHNNMFKFMGETTGANVHRHGIMATNLASVSHPGITEVTTLPEIQKVVADSEKALRGIHA